MTSNSPTAAPKLAGRTLTNTMHICAFFRSKEEEERVMMPFFQEGYERGEKIFHIVDPKERAEHLCSCARHGFDVDAAQQSGQLEVKVWEDAYLFDGCFAADRMVQMVEDVLTEASEQFPRARLMGKMEWALESLPGVDEIVEYEAKLNRLIPRFPHPVVCVYDLNMHSAGLILDVLRTHPMVIVGGVLQENPLYIPPDEFLAELKERNSVAASAAEPRVGLA